MDAQGRGDPEKRKAVLVVSAAATQPTGCDI